MGIVAIIGQLLVAIVPWIMETFNKENMARRRNEEIQKAIATNNADDLTRLLSVRVDRVRLKQNRTRAGQ